MLTDAGMVDVYRGGIQQHGLLEPPDDGPAILVYDIETTPLLGWAWRRFKPIIEDIELPSYLLCYGYQWFGQPDIGWVGLNQDPDYEPLTAVDLFNGMGGNTTRDRWAVERLACLFDRADITIAHNGDRFDTPKANTYFRRNGFPPPSPYQAIDTFKETKRVFADESFRLDYLSHQAGRGHKEPHEKGMGMWFRCMSGDQEAWATMERYNRRDVELLHDWYEDIRPWIGMPGKKAHPNLGHWAKGDRVCSKCGSDRLTPAATPHRAMVSEWEVWRCLECGGLSRARVRKTQRDGQGVKAL